MKQLALIGFFLLLLSSCGNKGKAYIPEKLLTEQEMIGLMTDVQIIEAYINYQKTQEREHVDSVPVKPVDYVALTKLYYDQVFEHYGIDDSLYVQNMRYYTMQPAVLERIMDSVVQRLAKEQ